MLFNKSLPAIFGVFLIGFFASATMAQQPVQVYGGYNAQQINQILQSLGYAPGQVQVISPGYGNYTQPLVTTPGNVVYPQPATGQQVMQYSVPGIGQTTTAQTITPGSVGMLGAPVVIRIRRGSGGYSTYGTGNYGCGNYGYGNYGYGGYPTNSYSYPYGTGYSGYGRTMPTYGYGY